jgi:hypothetical protein
MSPNDNHNRNPFNILNQPGIIILTSLDVLFVLSLEEFDDVHTLIAW